MTNKTALLILVALAVLGISSGVSIAKEPAVVTLKALMIQAQNDPAPIDRRLERVEYKLRRVFVFQFYKYVGQGSISLPPGGQGVIELEEGHRLFVNLSGGRRNNAEIRWLHDDRPLLSTSVKLSQDGPLVLGGVPANGGKLIVVLSAQ